MSNIVKANNEKEIDVVDVSMFKGMKTGFEETNNETFKTPFLKILQSISPEVKKKETTYVEGAEEGLFYNPVTGMLVNEIDVIVLKITHNLVGWKPNRGGFVGVFDKADELRVVARKDGLKKYDAEGNELSDTVSFFCLNANKLSDVFVFPMSNSALKHARNFSTRIRMLEANGKPIGVTYAGVWTIKTVLQKNDKGSWYDIGSTPVFKRFITKNEYENYVKSAYDMIDKAVTDYSQMETASTETEETQY
jgi:hypothetical protein